MATSNSEQELSSLVINRVPNQETFNNMVTNNQVQPDQLYFIEGIVDTDKYHTTGSWNGLTYTATSVNGADNLQFTIPTGTSSTTVAVGDHTHTYSDVGAAAASHTHGNITNDGKINQTNNWALQNGDGLIVFDANNSNKLERTGITFDASDETKVLSKKGSWVDLPKVATYNALGLVKPAFVTSGSATGFGTAGTRTGNVTINTRSDTNDRYYIVEADKDGRLFVNVPWTNINSSYLTANSDLAWNKLTGVPDAFPPESHTHGNITNDGKRANHQTSGNANTYRFLREDGTWTVPAYTTDTNTIPSAYCDTASGTAAKTATCTDYALTSKTYIHVLLKNANTAASPTLSINGKTAKAIKVNGNNVSTTSGNANYLNAGSYIVYYDGTNYHFRTDGKLPGDISGTASNITGTLSLDNLTKGDANTALMGQGSSSPAYVNVAPSIAITAGTSSDAPKINLTVLGVSGETAQELTKATTGVYGATKLYDGIDSDSTTLAATAHAVKTAYDTAISVAASADALVYKGTIAGNSNTANNGAGRLTPAANCGDVYKVTTAGYVNGLYVEVGDMIICCATNGTEAATTSNYETIRANWNIIQTSEGTVSTSETSATDGNIVVFSGATGRFIKTSSKSLTTSTPTSSADDTTVPTSKAVWNAIAALDVNSVGGGTGEYISAISEADGKISATKTKTSVSNSWTDGTTAGPKIVTTVNGVAGTGVAIPSASTSVSGVVNTGTQSFQGNKTFNSETFLIKSNIIRFQNTAGTTAQATTGGDNPTLYPYVTSIHIGDGREVTLDEYKDGALAIHANSGLFLHTSTPIEIYKSNQTYTVGKIVAYERSYYKCKTDITEPEEWDSTHWQSINTSSGYIKTDAKYIQPIETNTTALGSSSYTFKALYIGTANQYGSSTKPIYWSSGLPTECSTYAGGTKVTLNGSDKGAGTASFYAPTSAGTSDQILTSSGTGAPTWKTSIGVANGGTGNTTFTQDCIITYTSNSKLESRGLKVTGATNADTTITPYTSNKNLNIEANGTGMISMTSTTGKLTVSSNYGSLILQSSATSLTLGNNIASGTSGTSEGTITLYSASTAAHIIDGESTTANHTHTFPNKTGYIVIGSTDDIGSDTGPVYLSDGELIECANIVQTASFTLTGVSGAGSATIGSDTTISSNTEVVQISVDYTTASYLNSPISWTITNNRIVLSASVTTDESVTGKIYFIKNSA